MSVNANQRPSPNCSTFEPAASVVIPARNEAAYVRAALASVAAQRLQPGRLEVVVVDNGSDDGTAEVVEACAEGLPRLPIRLVKEPVAGLARAKNCGARSATGQVLIFLDADSRLLPGLVESVLTRVRAGFPAGSIAVWADSDDWLERGFFALMEAGKRWFGVRAQMLYCTRELFERCGGFDERLCLGEDSDLLARLPRAGTPVCHLTESGILTSPRRLRGRPLRLAIMLTFLRWALAHAGIGRRWQY